MIGLFGAEKHNACAERKTRALARTHALTGTHLRALEEHDESDGDLVTHDPVPAREVVHVPGETCAAPTHTHTCTCTHTHTHARTRIRTHTQATIPSRARKCTHAA